jgi:hypothetical protein
MTDPQLLQEPKVRHYKIPVSVLLSGEDAVHEELKRRSVPGYDELGTETRADLARGRPNPFRVDDKGRYKVATVKFNGLG